VLEGVTELENSGIQNKKEKRKIRIFTSVIVTLRIKNPNQELVM
jgi:hypothetical protein